MSAVQKRCYCLGQVCGKDPLQPTDRMVHFDAQINWGADDIRDPWSGSYDFGSFACVARWAEDRRDDHDGRVLTAGIDPAPAPAETPPTTESTIDSSKPPPPTT